jgi:hypothetical protein
VPSHGSDDDVAGASGGRFTTFDPLVSAVTGEEHRCRRCGSRLVVGLVASPRRTCCLNATPVVGICPEHGPVGPENAVDGST